MLRNYLKIAIRTFSRNSLYTFLNGFGLALGLTCSLLILLWVNSERQVDRFHPDGERIYRSYWYGVSDAGEVTFTQGASPYALYALLREYDGVENVAYYDEGTERMLKLGDKVFREKGAWGSTSLFEIFDFPMLAGGVDNAKNNLNTIFISDVLAQKLFGGDWRQQSIGATLRIDDKEETTVAGIFRKPGKNSSLQFDFIENIAKIAEERPQWAQSWGAKGARVFSKLPVGVDPDKVEDYVNPIYKDSDGYGVGGDAMMLFPFEDNYLWTKFEQGVATGGRIQYLRIFFGAALFLILIACINFINLSTAQSAKRAREVGIRKTVGARRNNLVIQFLSETGMLVFLALFLSIAAGVELLPLLNNLTDKAIAMPLDQPVFWVLMLGLGLLLTVVAGLYPAFVLSIFQPAKVLKGSGSAKSGQQLLRKSLVVFQFTLSTILIISTITVHNQLQLIQSENLGLDRSNVLTLEMSDPVREKYDNLKEKLLQSPAVSQVLRTSSSPVDVSWINVNFEFEGKDPEQGNYFYILNTEANFADVFGLEMLEGRFFDENISTDTAGVILNETGLKQLHLEDPIGKTLAEPDGPRRYHILGIVKDFPFKSLHTAVEPLILQYAPEITHQLLIKAAPGETVRALDQLKKSWAAVFPNYPLEYKFLDDQYAQMYESEITTGKLAYMFAGIAILISCLGLFGLITFIALQKTKEIGIRKVLGASVAGIVALLSRDFLKLVSIALLIGAPLAWYLMYQWLKNFAFQVAISWWVYVLAAVIALGITFVTVSFQSIRAALANPVHALKTE